MKKLLVPFILFFIYFNLLTPSYAQFSARLIPTPSIDYTLPFYGLAPDNPFYFLKAIRDRILLATTRDYVKKSELLLIFADKKIGMAKKFANESKYTESLLIAREAEENFLSSIERLEQSKKYGGFPAGEIEKRGRASLKHEDMIKQIKEMMPVDRAGEIEDIDSIRQKANDKIIALKEERSKMNK